MTERQAIVIGIDVGTTSVKALAFDVRGRERASCFVDVPMSRPTPERAEQDMTEIWNLVCTVVRSVARQCADAEVVALGVTGQGDGAWLVDEHGEPVGPAILWMDGRAAAIAGEWAGDERGRAIRRFCGSSVMAGGLPEILEHLESEDPQRARRARWNLNSKDFVRFKLTGVACTDPSDASETYWDPATGQYSEELLRILGHEEHARLLPPVVEPTHGEPLRADIASQLGLPAGIPVATGTMDTVAAAIGLGAVLPGQGYAIVGTTNFLGVIRDDSAVPGPNVGVVGMGRHGRKVFEMAPMAGAPNLDWAKQVTGQGAATWREVEVEALRCPRGARGLTYFPYGALSGERAPFLDAEASASVLGLSIATTGPEMLRAAFEGVAMTLRECAEAVGVDGDLRLAGGAARSELLPRILADVIGLPVTCSSTGENGARGAAVCGFVAAGLAGSLEEVTQRFDPSDRRYEPCPEARALYDAAFEFFLSSREAVRQTWRGSRRLRDLDSLQKSLEKRTEFA